MNKVTRAARRMFLPVYVSNEPAKLDLRYINAARAVEIIRGLGDLVRVGDGDPLEASYVFTTGARSLFQPTTLDTILWRIFS